MPALGIDYGSKRIGLSISRDLQFTNRLKTIAGGEDSIAEIVKIIEAESIQTVVVGLPRNLNGEETGQTQTVRKFVAELEDAIHANVVLQDEADTSNLARDRLRSQGLNHRQVEEEVDAEAAVIILEDYLSEKRA